MPPIQQQKQLPGQDASAAELYDQHQIFLQCRRYYRCSHRRRPETQQGQRPQFGVAAL